MEPFTQTGDMMADLARADRMRRRKEAFDKANAEFMDDMQGGATSYGTSGRINDEANGDQAKVKELTDNHYRQFVGQRMQQAGFKPEIADAAVSEYGGASGVINKHIQDRSAGSNWFREAADQPLWLLRGARNLATEAVAGDDAVQRMRGSENFRQETAAARQSDIGMAGTLSAGLVGGLLDPLNLLTLGAGIAPKAGATALAKTALQSGLKAGAKEAAEQATKQAAKGLGTRLFEGATSRLAAAGTEGMAGLKAAAADVAKEPPLARRVLAGEGVLQAGAERALAQLPGLGREIAPGVREANILGRSASASIGQAPLRAAIGAVGGAGHRAEDESRLSAGLTGAANIVALGSVLDLPVAAFRRGLLTKGAAEAGDELRKPLSQAEADAKGDDILAKEALSKLAGEREAITARNVIKHTDDLRQSSGQLATSAANLSKVEQAKSDYMRMLSAARSEQWDLVNKYEAMTPAQKASAAGKKLKAKIDQNLDVMLEPVKSSEEAFGSLRDDVEALRARVEKLKATDPKAAAAAEFEALRPGEEAEAKKQADLAIKKLSEAKGKLSEFESVYGRMFRGESKKK